jgi:mannose-6-phosphate isomerase-like protein (cupin superfamily)
MNERKGKVWGTTSLLFKAPGMEVHLLEIKKGGFCSEHVHARKINHFIVLGGKLRIKVWEGDKPDETILGPGQSTEVPVDTFHQFLADEATICLEIYQAADISEDIGRRTQGGIADAPNL